jgi:hypothetical protein
MGSHCVFDYASRDYLVVQALSVEGDVGAALEDFGPYVLILKDGASLTSYKLNGFHTVVLVSKCNI